MSCLPLDRFGGSLHELCGEFLARPHRQHDDRLGLESHELVRRALLVVLEDAQLVIGQLNRAHTPIITRNPIPIHPECAPRGGRPSPRRAELTAVYLVSYLLKVKLRVDRERKSQKRIGFLHESDGSVDLMRLERGNTIS